MRTTIPALALLAACRAAPTPPTLTPENVPAQRVSVGYVLVTQGAWLRTAPDANAAGARANPLAGSPTSADNIQSVWVVRQTADEGAWVEIENLTPEEAAPHCYGSIERLASYKLRLHVRRDDLVPVTKREVEVSFDDGSGVDLGAGVALGREGVRYRIGDSVHAVVAIEPEHVGAYYAAPTAAFDEAVDPETLQDLPPGPFIVDGQRLDLPDVDQALVEDGPDPDHQLVTVALSCSRYHGLVERTELGFGTPARAGRYVSGGSRVHDRPSVAAGAALTWSDGTPAGETIHRIDILWESERIGDRVCFGIPLRAQRDMPDEPTGTEEWFLTACAHEDDWSAGFGG